MSIYFLICVDQLVKSIATSKYIISLAILQNGLIAGGSYDNSVKIWDVEVGSLMKTITGFSGSHVHSLAVLQNGYLACGNYGIKIVNPNTGDLVTILLGYDNWVSSFAVLDNGLLASGYQYNKGLIMIWNTLTCRSI